MPPLPAPKKTWLPQKELQVLHVTLGQAQDAQLGRLVALLDAMPERGTLDELIAPLRPRLAQLRPERRLRFDRLLFLPLDPLIVPAARWQPGHPTIPRTALASLAHATRAALGPQCQEVDRMIAGQTNRAAGVIARAGALLWPAAAQALARSEVPACWMEQTGMVPALYADLACNSAAVLEQVLRLQALLHEVEIGMPLLVAPLEAMLRAVRIGRPAATDMMVALILARLPQAAALLHGLPVGVAGGEAVVQAAIRAARHALIDRLEVEGGTEAAVMSADLSAVAGEVRRIAALLQSLHAGGGGPLRRRMEALLQRLDVSCVTRFTTALGTEFVRPLEAMEAKIDDSAVIRLEGAARHLAELGHEARAIGSRETYATLLRQTADAVKAFRPGGALTLVDRVRLVEILAGPEEAWTMLESSPAL